MSEDQAIEKQVAFDTMTNDSALMQRIGGSLRSDLRDVVLIVVGILIAFSLDAWWDRRVEQDHVAALLGSVRADLTEALEIIDRDQHVISGSKEAILDLLDLTGPDAPTDLPDTFPALVYRAMETRTLDLPRGGFDALFMSGQLDEIEDEHFLSLLTAWDYLLQEAGEQFEWLRKDRDEVIGPLVDEHIPLRNVLPSSRAFAPPSRFDSQNENLLKDRRFEARLAYRLQLLTTATRELAEVRSAAEELLRLIDEHLEAQSS